MRSKWIMANLRVADVEAAKDFYTGYLGLSAELSLVPLDRLAG